MCDNTGVLLALEGAAVGMQLASVGTAGALRTESIICSIKGLWERHDHQRHLRIVHPSLFWRLPRARDAPFTLGRRFGLSASCSAEHSTIGDCTVVQADVPSSADEALLSQTHEAHIHGAFDGQRWLKRQRPDPRRSRHRRVHADVAQSKHLGVLGPPRICSPPHGLAAGDRQRIDQFSDPALFCWLRSQPRCQHGAGIQMLFPRYARLGDLGHARPIRLLKGWKRLALQTLRVGVLWHAVFGVPPPSCTWVDSARPR